MLIDKNHPQIQALLQHMNKIEGSIEELIATCASWEWMNQREVVQRLNMSPEYLAKLRRSGQLPCSKIDISYHDDCQAVAEINSSPLGRGGSAIAETGWG